MKYAILVQKFPGVGGIERSIEILTKNLGYQNVDIYAYESDYNSEGDNYNIKYVGSSFLKKFISVIDLILFFPIYIFRHKEKFNKYHKIIIRNTVIAYIASRFIDKRRLIIIPPSVSKSYNESIQKGGRSKSIVKRSLRYLKWELQKRIYSFCENKIFNSSIHKIVFSNNVKQQILKNYNCRKFKKYINIIPPGAHHKFECIRENKKLREIKEKMGFADELIYIYVGRVSKEKNIPRLINDFVNLEFRAKLLLVGPVKMELSELPGNVLLLGKKNIDELNKLYNISNVLILPSLAEGFGQVLVEALACGIPVGGVSTDKNAINEIISCKEFGYFEDFNSDGGLKEVLFHFYHKKSFYLSRREYISNKSRKKFDWSNIINSVTQDSAN